MLSILLHVKRCCVVCSCCLQSGHVGVVCVVGDILCRYECSSGDLPVRSCDSVLRVFRGNCCSDSCICGA